MEEIIVRADSNKQTLEFTIHWEGGRTHATGDGAAALRTETATPVEALEIIRRMAVRHGDDQIASVLNRTRVFYRKGEALESEPRCHRAA